MRADSSKRAAGRRKKPASTRLSATPAAQAQVQAYLAALPPRARTALKQVRAGIRAAAPDAVEAFSYGIPAFRFNGRPLVWYAAWQHHASLYPITTKVRRALAPALRGYETSKGTVRFPLDAPMPAALIKRFVKVRLSEVPRKD